MLSLHKKLLCLALAGLFSLSAASGELNPAVLQKIDDFMHLRMTLSTLETRDEAIEQIRAFENSSLPGVEADFGQESALILENFIVMEIFNYYYDDPPMGRSAFRQMLADQKAKNDAYFTAHKGETFSAWFWATCGDVFSCWTTFSIKDILFNGMEIKDYYLTGYSEDEHCSYLLTDLAQWYLQAPRVGGGSRSRARSYFEAARASARTQAETYFADIFLSQFLFEQKEYRSCGELLDEADSLNPGSRYIALIRAQNQAGLSLYQYNRKRSNVDAGD